MKIDACPNQFVASTFAVPGDLSIRNYRHTTAAILFAATYSALLVAAFYLVPAGPRAANALSVAKDGSFTVSTWHKSTAATSSIELWSADLRRIRRVPFSGYVVGFANAVSSDGKTAAAETTDGRENHVDVVRVADGAILRRIPFAGQSAMRMHLFDDGRQLLLANAETVTRYGVVDAVQEQFEGYECYPRIDPTRNFLLFSRLVAAPTELPGRVISLRRREYFRADEKGLSLLHSLQASSDHWDGLGTAIGAKGTIAIQKPNQVLLRSLEGKTWTVPLDMSVGWVHRFDPSERFLVLGNRPLFRLFDLQKQSIVASYESGEGWYVGHMYPQDESHFLLIENALSTSERSADSINDRVVRWNWRTGESSHVAVGSVDYATAKRRKTGLLAAFAGWLICFSVFCKRSRHGAWPLVALGAVLGFMALWGYHAPDFEQLFVDYETASVAWLLLVPAWLTVAAAASVIAVHGPGRLTPRAAVSLVAVVTAMGALHHLQADGGWFFSFTALFMSGVLVAASCGRIVWTTKQSGADWQQLAKEVISRMKISLKDVLVCVGASAIILAIMSRFDSFDLSLKSIAWSLLSGAGFSGVILLATWAALGGPSWWKRYLLLLGVVGGTAWSLSRVRWIDTGDMTFMLNEGTHLAILMCWLAVAGWYTGWLYRKRPAGAVVKQPTAGAGAMPRW